MPRPWIDRVYLVGTNIKVPRGATPTDIGPIIKKEIAYGPYKGDDFVDSRIFFFFKICISVFCNVFVATEDL